MKMEQCVPKRRRIKFRRRGITQKKSYNIQNMAKVWNQVGGGASKKISFGNKAFTDIKNLKINGL